MRVLALLFFMLLFSIPAAAYHDDLDGLLADHVQEIKHNNNIIYNGVDYDAWNADDRHDAVMQKIQNTAPSTLKSKNEKLAFWINAYNVLTIDLITRENERESIKNLGGFLSSPWKKHSWNINGKPYTLDQIEHSIIRPMGEPRIHFAINCAAKSCPDLRSEAYRASRLNDQLTDQTNKTFANATKGFKADGNTIYVSKVMDWFDEDFNNGDLKDWITDTFPNKVNADTDIKFFKYNWSLNKK